MNTTSIIKIKRNTWLQLFVIYTRYLIGSAFVFASIVKIKGERFSRPGINDPINTPFHLFETLYQTGLWWQIIGWGQFIAGTLLLTQRYALLGAVANFPIIINVFFITISLNFSGTPLISSSMLLANILLLIWHWPQLKVLVNQKPNDFLKGTVESLKIWELIGVGMLITTILTRIWHPFNEFLWAIAMLVLGLIALVYWFVNNRKMKI